MALEQMLLPTVTVGEASVIGPHRRGYGICTGTYSDTLLWRARAENGRIYFSQPHGDLGIRDGGMDCHLGHPFARKLLEAYMQLFPAADTANPQQDGLKYHPEYQRTA